jgi:Ca2+-binding RTX toxin-like protein
MAVYTVSDTGTLSAMLTLAQPGDVLALTPGTYSGVLIDGLNLGGVTITSADPLNPATITDLYVHNSSGVTFSKLEFTAIASFGDNAWRVTGSQDVHFDHLNVHGSLDNNPQDDVIGMLIRTSSNVSVTNSEFQQLVNAVSHLDDTFLTVSGNYFHDLQTDAVRGGGSSNVVVSNNTFTNFYPKAGDHPDAIQFWTTNETTSAHDITVTDNIYMRGAGQIAQGIFIRDEVGTLPFQNVTITGNTIVGGMYNGIAVLGGNNVTIDKNTVEGFPDQKSWVRLEDVTGATISNSSADQFLTSVNDAQITQTANLTPAAASDNGAAALTQWQVSHPTGTQVIGDSGNNIIVGNFAQNYLRGMDGNDIIWGGPEFDDINGNQGNDTIHGGGGGDWLVGGQGDDLIYGGSAGDLLLGNLGNDTLIAGDGGETLRGGQGDDSIAGGSGNDFISGDRGNDTVSGGGGADLFHSFAGAGTMRVLDFSYAQGDRVMLDPGTIYNAHPSASGLDTVIDIVGGGQVTLVGVQYFSLPAGWITN